ncbi:MAG: hypothetical protein EXR92_04780 [Gemmatimonadetes bacterium]|nr:hypothetical protein [Gemmatimonadota bacterium]
MKMQWFGAVAVSLGLAASLAFVQTQEVDSSSAVEAGIVAEAGSATDTGSADGQVVQQALFSGQPIAFPHSKHAGELQIDCQYCHFSAERSQTAGIPPVATCMGCHQFVAGTENPEQIEIIRGYAARQEAIPWNRIYDLPDHVQFQHMRHIAAGVNCTSCHGNVRGLGVIQEVNQPLTMGWCVGCHLVRGASRDCTVCHY